MEAGSKRFFGITAVAGVQFDVGLAKGFAVGGNLGLFGVGARATRAWLRGPAASLSKATMKDLFRRMAHATSNAVGSSWAFLIAISVILLWAALGPLFRFSDTWQLVINTGTTIVTFLMVFLIQNAQNRDARAIHLKLDELLRALHGARTGLVNLESHSEEELLKLQNEFERLGNEYGVHPLEAHHVERELIGRRRRASGARSPAPNHLDDASPRK